MRPYKLKHIPTGLYYQPHKHRGSHLSTKGKIYQSGVNGLSTSFRYAEYYNDLETRKERLYIAKDSAIHKKLLACNCILTEAGSSYYNQLLFITQLKDWIKEEI